MNRWLLVFAPASIKKQVYFVLAAVAIITAMPMAAVFALGTGTLSLLSFGSADAVGLYQGPLDEGNTYEWGNCTYWAYHLRMQAHDPIPNTWGNANTWAIRATLDGYLVDHSPSPGAIMQTSRGQYGHVAYVTDVDASTGVWTISEMNVKGLDIVDTVTYPASDDQQYSFIHDKETFPNVLSLGN